MQTLFSRLEAERETLLSALKDMPDAFHHAAPGKWSIQQILAHIVAGERLSVKYLSKKILGMKDTVNTGLWEEFKMLVLILSQRLPIKFKAPRVVLEHTPTYVTIEQLSADWKAAREELRMLLEQFDDRDIRKRVYRHVRAGRLNVQHALIFLREHILHHRPQIDRLIKLRKP